MLRKTSECRILYSQGGEAATRLAHNQKIAGSIPAPGIDFMKKLTVALATAMLVFTGWVQAATITFTGVVDRSVQFPVGSTITATFKYNPKKAGAINHYTITIDETVISGGQKTNPGNVALGTDPTQGSVYYQIFNGSVIEITLQAGTPDGVIPPLELFNLNDWVLNGTQTSGHMTSLPVITP